MEDLYIPTQEDIDAAWPSSARRFGYQPVRETISITLATHTNWQRDGVLFPFVRLGAIPERFHPAIEELSMNSTCPSVDEKRDTFYTHDVYRWLRAIGIEAEFVAP